MKTLARLRIDVESAAAAIIATIWIALNVCAQSQAFTGNWMTITPKLDSLAAGRAA